MRQNWKGESLKEVGSEKKIDEAEAAELMEKIEELAFQKGLRGRAREKIPSEVKAEVESKAREEEVLKADGSRPLDGPFDHDGDKFGAFGVSPASRTAAYTVTNATEDRAFDADNTTVDELADIIATIISDLKSYGLFE